MYEDSHVVAVPVCRLCLNSNRRLSSLNSLSCANEILTDMQMCLHVGSVVCWECRAMLCKVRRFKMQVHRAEQLLKEGCASVNSTTLSSLGITSKETYDFVFTDGSEFDDYKQEITKNETLDGTWDAEEKCEVWVNVPECPATDDTLAQFDGHLVNTCPSEPSEVKNSVCVRTPKSITDDLDLVRATPEDLEAQRQRAALDVAGCEFKCDTCLIKFTTWGKMHKHSIKYHSESAGAHVCEVCSSRFTRREAFDAHRSAHYTLYRCREPGCHYTDACAIKVRTHCLVHDPRENIIKREAHSCNVCGKSFCGAQSLSLHLQSHDTKRTYECDICSKTFATRRQIQIHVNVHTMRAMCDVCGKRLPNQRRLKLHSLAHLDQSYRAYECVECHKRFIDKYKLLVHSRQHTGEKPFRCDTCSTKYVSKEQLTYHIKKHHTDGAVHKEYKPRTKTLFRNERICYAKQQRSQTHHNTDEKQETRDGKYECNICGKLLTTQQNLQTHYGVHSSDRPYRCDVCDKTFKYRPQLCTHKQKHSGEKSHQCNICGARFTFKAILSNHMKSHSSEKPYRCEICDLTFKYKSGLWTHKLIHKGEKPHQCNICGSRFTLKGNLTGHMKTHTNEKPYGCSVCGRKFPWRRNLKNHYKTHAKEQRVQSAQ